MRNRARRVERTLQEGCVTFFREAVFQGPGAPLLFAVPNGEARDPVTAAQLVGIPMRPSSKHKRRVLTRMDLPPEQRLSPFGQGVVPGVYDLVLVLPGGRTVFIECKRPANKLAGDRGGDLSNQQILFANRLAELGHHYATIESVDEFASLLERYGVRLRIRWWGPEAGKPGQLVPPPA